MKILWVKAGGLYPLDTGGKIRSYHILRELALRHEVTVFTFYGAHADDAHNHLAGLFSQVLCVPLTLPVKGSLGQFLDYARNFFSSQPYNISRYCRPEVKHRLADLLQRRSYDVILCDFAFAGGVIPWDHPTPKVLFAHNVEALIWERHYQMARNPLWKVVCWREFRAVAQAEQTYLKRADHVLTVSATDRDWFANIVDSSRITVVPTGVDIDFFQPVYGPELPNRLVFTGSMDWEPNEDAVLYFLDKIFPQIQRQIPESTFWVVGRHPSARLRHQGDRSHGVRVTGSVEDVRPFMRDASIFVVPLRIGSGTRLKIFEAMAMGKAVVSTSVGAEGLPVQHGKHIILADNAEDFARMVVGLLRDPEGRERLGRAARQLVAEKYSWASVSTQAEAVLMNVARKGSERLGRDKSL
jgi:sugar transferase (PEP-CTERM/EpsH1 system associated)